MTTGDTAGGPREDQSTPLLESRVDVPKSSRRIDWRFLLSTPDLGTVGALEGVDEELEQALRLFSSGLTVVRDFRQVHTTEPSYDVVVLADPPADQVIAAARTLRSGGWAYIEASALRPRPLHRPRVVSAYVRVLRRAGLQDVTGYWHVPNLAACEEIAQLDRPGSLAFVFNRRQRLSRVDLLKDRLAMSLARCGLLGYLAPYGSAVGRRGGATP